jgi:hypothetical protein
MDDFWIGVGTVLALFGPLLLLPIVWIVYKAVRSVFGWISPESVVAKRRAPALGLSVIVIAGVMLASYLPGRSEFDRLCTKHAAPVLIDSVSVAGFYRTHLFPYEAHQYLKSGFEFVEAPDPYADSTLIRYSLGSDGNPVQKPVSELESEFAVDERFETTPSGLRMTVKQVYALESGRVLGIAYDILYEGGPLSIFLGVYGMSSCPDLATTTGSEWFRTFYRLEERLLRSSS